MPATKKAPDVYEIISRGELAGALEVLAQVKAQESRVQAELEAEVAKLKQRFQERLYFRVPKHLQGDGVGERLPCAAARTILETAMIRFVEAHPERVFTSQLKTERFTHGEISKRNVPAAVALKDGETKSTILKRLQEKTGILKKLPEWLKKLPLWRERSAKQFLKLSVDLVSCTDVKKQLDAGALDKKDLEQAGYVLVDEREAISVKAYEHVVRAEA